MLTKADDYPIHQTPEPIAFAGTDRNFYDRYFFNGYDREGELFFAAALGVYPQLNVMDASFSVILDGKQHNVHASKTLHMERLDTQVGPIEIEVLEPLRVLSVTCDDPEHGIHADVQFTARVPAIEEPRFTRKQGSQTVMDITRLTQNGTYTGEVRVGDQHFKLDPAKFWGTRDRSWGIRSVGMRDPQTNPYGGTPQFFWLWAPLNFEDYATFYHLNADGDGAPWNTMGRLASATDSAESQNVTSRIDYEPGTRHARHASLEFTALNGNDLTIELTPQTTFYMKGLGYGHPEWGHGLYHGELETGYDTIDLATVSKTDPTHFHIQALCAATLKGLGKERRGQGVLEQLAIGPFAPYGFKELMDVAQ